MAALRVAPVLGDPNDRARLIVGAIGIREQADRLVAAAIQDARSSGTTWQTIGDAPKPPTSRQQSSTTSRQAGSYESHGVPSAVRAADVTVIDTPLAFEAGDYVARVTFSGRQDDCGVVHPRPQGPLTRADNAHYVNKAILTRGAFTRSCQTRLAIDDTREFSGM